jgi:hypothetical protein
MERKRLVLIFVDPRAAFGGAGKARVLFDLTARNHRLDELRRGQSIRPGGDNARRILSRRLRTSHASFEIPDLLLARRVVGNNLVWNISVRPR